MPPGFDKGNTIDWNINKKNEWNKIKKLTNIISSNKIIFFLQINDMSILFDVELYALRYADELNLNWFGKKISSSPHFHTHIL